MRALKLWLIMLICFSFFNQAMAAETDDGLGDDTAKDDQQIYYMYNGIDLATTLKFQYDRPRIVIKSVYPILRAEDEDDAVDGFNDLVLQQVKAEAEDFKKRVALLKPYQAKMNKTAIKNDLYVDYDSSFINTQEEHILSIRFTIAGVNSGATHGFHYHRVLNYDLDAGEEIALSDLFLPDVNYLEQLSLYSRKILEKRLPNKAMVISGTEPTLENFKNWNLKPFGIVITFDEPQVAPSVYGAQTVVIPYALLEDIIDPDSPIFVCLQNRSRCTHNNLLTGGFIDEAINTRHRGFNPILS